MNQDRVIEELAKLAFVNPANVINFDEATVKLGASDDDLACIQSVKVKTVSGEKSDTTEREVRLCDKKAALELLGKHLGMFKDKVEVSGLGEEMSKLDDIIKQMRGGE